MKLILAIFLVIFSHSFTYSQSKITLEQALERVVYKTKKFEKLKLNYQNTLLEFKNFKNDYLPSASINISPFHFNHSIEQLQNATDGQYSYIEDYNGTSSANISIKQKIAATGGYVVMGTSLNFLREFNSNRNSFNTRPFYISISQPLWGGRKSYKFTKDIETLNRSAATKRLVKSIADYQKEVATLYAKAYIALCDVAYNKRMASASDTLLQEAELKYKYGRITLYDYKRIELQKEEYYYLKSESLSDYKQCLRDLCCYLDFYENIEIQPIITNKLKLIDKEFVFQKILENNPQYIEDEIQLTTAQKELWNSKRETLASSSVSFDYGVNQFAHKLSQAYNHPSKQQNVQITLSVPIFNWGTNRNKRRIAENEYQQKTIDIEDRRKNFRLYVYNLVESYNDAIAHLKLALNTCKVAEQTYHSMIPLFSLARVTIGDLTEMHNTLLGYKKSYNDIMLTCITNLFELRALSLYDFENSEDLMFTINI